MFCYIIVCLIRGNHFMFFSIIFPSCTGSILLSFIKSFGSFTMFFIYLFFKSRRYSNSFWQFYHKFFLIKKAVEDAAIPIVCLYVMAHNTPLPSPSSSPPPPHICFLCFGCSTCINFYMASFLFLSSSQE